MPLLLGITHRVDQPSGTSYANSQSVGSLPQRTICGHERCLTGSIDRHGYEHVVNTARCMENSDAVSDALLDAAASSIFEDHDNGFGEPIRFSSSTKLVPRMLGLLQVDRDHPVGRDPTTFAASMGSTNPLSQTRRSGRPGHQDCGIPQAHLVG